MTKIEKLKQYIEQSDNIVFFSGAGVSTASGLRDFRGKNGLYKDKNKYPCEYLLSKNCFYNNPILFYDFYKKINLTNVKPNIVHYYISNLEKRKDVTVVTQNIDGLHTLAGSKNVLEIHGTAQKNYCVKCHKFYDYKYIIESKGIPICSCGGIIKPEVTLYGEELPTDYLKAIEKIKSSSLFIVLGTSLTVEPASSLIRYCKNKIVIINNEKTNYDFMADLVINEDLIKVFKELK